MREPSTPPPSSRRWSRPCTSRSQSRCARGGTRRDRHARRWPGASRMPGAAAITIHGRTAKQSYSGTADWDFVARVAELLRCRCSAQAIASSPREIVERLAPRRQRRVRRPRRAAQPVDPRAGAGPAGGPSRARGHASPSAVSFCSTTSICCSDERVREEEGFRHCASALRVRERVTVEAPRHDRWIINKLRALCSWYTKGLDNGSHLRIQINAAESLDQLREIIEDSFSLAARGRMNSSGSNGIHAPSLDEDPATRSRHRAAAVRPSERSCSEWRAKGADVIAWVRRVPGFDPPPYADRRRSAPRARRPRSHVYSDGRGLPVASPRALGVAGAARRQTSMRTARCIITAGGNQAFQLALTTLIDPGDHVVLVSPFFLNHEMAVRSVGAVPVEAPVPASRLV